VTSDISLTSSLGR